MERTFDVKGGQHINRISKGDVHDKSLEDYLKNQGDGEFILVKTGSSYYVANAVPVDRIVKKTVKKKTVKVEEKQNGDVKNNPSTRGKVGTGSKGAGRRKGKRKE